MLLLPVAVVSAGAAGIVAGGAAPCPVRTVPFGASRRVVVVVGAGSADCVGVADASIADCDGEAMGGAEGCAEATDGDTATAASVEG